MQRLLDKNLLYGDLLRVESATLRERYNRALEALCGRRTNLETFRIDQTGFSPEVAEELGDPLYLNPNGCNRKVILLTIEQAGLPVVDATFSSTRSVLAHFIEDNRAELFALTSRDVVYGELENSVYRIDTLDDVTSIKRIRVEVNTAQDLVSKAQTLAERITAFEASDDAWSDDTTLLEMIDLAEATGDIRRHPLVPSRVDYAQGNFYTTHFGGIYIFNEASTPTLISCDPDFTAEGRFGWLNPSGDITLQHIVLADTEKLAWFLDSEGLVRSLVGEQSPGALELLKRKLEFVVIDHAARSEGLVEPWPLGPEQMKRLIYRHFDELPDVFHQIAQVVRVIEQGDPLPEIAPDSPAHFYLLQPADLPDRELVGHLIARLAPFDALQLYVYNREVFCDAYGTWGEAKRAYVADFLERQYLTEEIKVGVPEAPDASQDEEERG